MRAFSALLDLSASKVRTPSSVKDGWAGSKSELSTAKAFMAPEASPWPAHRASSPIPTTASYGRSFRQFAIAPRLSLARSAGEREEKERSRTLTDKRWWDAGPRLAQLALDLRARALEFG